MQDKTNMYNENPTENLEIPAEQKEEDIPKKPEISLYVTSDRMRAEIKLQRTALQTLALEPEDIRNALKDAEIKCGISEERVEDLCKYPQYGVDLTIATGQMPTKGQDGYIKYFIETQRDLRPKEREDGTMDFKDLGYAQGVKKDQLLCEVVYPFKGEDGFDIYGNVLEGIMGKSPLDPQGSNTYYNEDKTELFAEKNGNVEIIKDKININELLTIKGNVDHSVGDIIFIGDIQVNGDVLPGFMVKSEEGSIVVKGHVEAAKINAAGSITVEEGINGMSRAEIKAGKSMKCKYIQNSSVTVEENLYSDSIMYCKVVCMGNIELSGKKGAIIGGEVFAGGRILAKNIGTGSHSSTKIIMGSIGTKLDIEIKELEERLKDIFKEELKAVQVINRFEALRSKGQSNPVVEKGVRAALINLPKYKTEKTILQKRIEEAKAEKIIRSQESSYIECQDKIHSGVQIVFGPLVCNVNSSYDRVRVFIADNDIKFSPLVGSGERQQVR